MLLIQTALEHVLENKGVGYLERPAGSTWTGLPTDGDTIHQVLFFLDWEEVTEQAQKDKVAFGKCRYFKAVLPDHIMGWEGVCLLSELSDEELEGVRVRRGHHGNLEHVMPGEKRPTQVVHIVLGNELNFPNGEVNEDTATVVTWYPGRLTRPDMTVKFI